MKNVIAATQHWIRTGDKPIRAEEKVNKTQIKIANINNLWKRGLNRIKPGLTLAALSGSLHAHTKVLSLMGSLGEASSLFSRNKVGDGHVLKNSHHIFAILVARW